MISIYDIFILDIKKKLWLECHCTECHRYTKNNHIKKKKPRSKLDEHDFKDTVIFNSVM